MFTFVNSVYVFVCNFESLILNFKLLNFELLKHNKS